MESSLIIIPKSRENEACPLFNGSWIEFAVANTRQYGNPIYRVKNEVEYLIVQYKLDVELQEVVLTTEEYYNYNWDEQLG